VLRNNLEAAHRLPPSEFRESKIYKQDSKIAIGKTMPEDPPTMALVTFYSLDQD
jgi:hypothetical protein